MDDDYTDDDNVFLSNDDLGSDLLDMPMKRFGSADSFFDQRERERYFLKQKQPKKILGNLVKVKRKDFV